MKAQFIYSVAALATFPIVVNAQVDAEDTGAITIQKDATSWSKESVDLAPGKYSFLSGINAFGKDAVLSITGAGIKQGVNKKLAATDSIAADFEITAKSKVTITVTAAAAMTANASVAESKIQLNFDFTKVAQLLKIEYNKVTNALAAANYEEKAQDAQLHSALYDRIVAIAGAKYAFYAANTEGLQAIYAGDQTNVADLQLYKDIVKALEDVLAAEKKYQLGLLDGDDGLKGLNARYDALAASVDVISYQTKALNDAKKAAEDARDAYNTDATAEKLQAAKDALKAYGDELTKEEGVKKDNEEAHTSLLETLSAVYGGTNSYYNTTVTQINTLYTARYADLKKALEPALQDIVTGEDYTSVTKAIQDSYEAKTAKSKKSELEIKIYEFKQKLTQKVSDFNTVKEQLAAVYVTYDAEKKAADDLVEKAEDFLETYKQAVDKAVKDFLDFIEANDEFKTVANLTDAKITDYREAIKAAKEEYTKQAGIYADYKTLKAEVEAQTTSLDGVKDDIDKDAKDTKKLSEEKFKPTTLWNTTITDIVDKITALDGAVDNNKTDATAFKAKNEYKNALKTIKDAIKSLKDNALQATALFAGFDDKYNTADELQKALMNPAVEPKDDLTKLNVWTNQVTIDDAVKARTPYKNFIDNTEGSITKVIAALKVKLNVMDANGPLKGFEGTILDYLKTKAVNDAASAVTTGTATMEAIKANYKADEQKFAQQMDIEECNGIRTNINNKAVVFEAAIDVLEKNIKDGLYGKVKGKKLQDELDAITKKIDDAKAVAAKEDATKDDLTKAYNSIKDLMDTDIATATTHADTYKNEFAQFKANYELLNGTKDDTSTASTVFGLKKKVAEQKEVIGNYKDLTDAQKTTFKNNVDAVEYKTKEGDPLKDVTYTIDNILTFIENAMQAEELKDAEVGKYQNVINELKGATMAPVAQASYMNELEGALKGIDFAKAKADVLKADPTESSFYYLLLTGTTTKGQYTKDFNDLKAKIEADTEITLNEKGTYNDEIAALKALVEGAAAKAKANLDAFNDAKKHYNNVPAAGSTDIKGAVQRYDEAWEKLLKCPSSKLEEQKTVITGMKAALDQLSKDAETNYNNGKASADDAQKIDDQIKAIENKVEEYTNEANYNAQVAADNKAVYDRILAAREAVDAVYATSATVINTYKNFQSTELKAATDQAKDELEALLACLDGYATAVGKIKAESDDVYGKTVSPAFFDKDETYKAEYEKIQKEIEDLTKALTDKINEFAGANVAASVKNYTDAIDASKAKVAKFSVDDKDLTTAVLDNLFKNIDKLLKDINDVKEDGTKINLLDAALVAAAKENTGIYALIPPVEQNQAQKALNDIIALNEHSDLLTEKADKDLLKKITDAANSGKAEDKAECVNKFSTWKTNLNDLKKKADQIAKDNKAIADATTAIDNANKALGTLNQEYQEFAAGYQVKETVEQIAADLAAYDATKVTATNAADWEKAAKAISERIEAVYVALYGFEVPVIEGLIDQAKEELLTYSGDKAAMAEAINTQEGNLKKAKDDVAAYLKDPKKGKSQKDALKALQLIESALNSYIKAMKDVNGTNLDAVIVANLEAEVKVQEDILNAAPANYSTAIQTALTDEFKAIKDDITTLRTYITTHKDEMSAYQANAEAMLKDIKDAIVALKAKADDLKAKEEAAAAEQAQIALANTWKTAQGLLDDADEDIAFMKSQLEAYGNGSKYANKVSKLDEQFIAANAILTAAKAEADGKEKVADKQKVANKAVTDITAALVGLADNCDDVVALSKAAYIDAFIANLTAQIIEDSWSNSENYTTTDKKTLTNMRNALIQSVANLKGDAEGKEKAGDQKGGNLVVKGVITTLNEGATQFGKDLNALVQAVKDMSLAEDVKGHITGGDEIGADDVQALINIIINGQEGEQNLEVCDINGDGRITVTDIIWLQFFDIFHEWPNMAATARGGYEMSDAVKMEVVSTRGNITRLAINLSNNDSYRAFQIGMQLPAGAKVVGQSLGDRVENAYLMHSQATEGNVRFMTIAFNSEFAGNEGAVLYVDVENLNGDVALTEAYFTNVELNEADLLSSGQTTSIRESITNALESAGQKIYNMGGRVMNGLKKGINIIRRNDGSNEKVIVK
ncbi:hypothetical protein M1D30_02110 [Prevotella sp. E15-22]|uniref:hypothetical protein n=1 Tax=Prevotella sp. E15-22 TaxID=2937774 RepID=UPI002058D72B|nr:hypothetical protein [Prevotella sp. E15-22]UPS44984.1 hypothetical protein M1D30_02110 [Prevotella sp. E15-22]